MPKYTDADALKEEVGHIAYVWSLGRACGKTLLKKAVNDYTNAVIAKIDNAPPADEEKIATEYCMKKGLVMIPMDYWEKVIAYENRDTVL